MKVLIIFIGLLFPTWFEKRRDRNGDAHPNNDWKFRGLLCILAGATLALVYESRPFDFWQFLFDFNRFTIASILFFSSIFPYWINYTHLKNGVTTFAGIPKHHIYSYRLLTRTEVFFHVVNHLSKKAWPDKESWWMALGWKGRAFVNGSLLLIGILLCLL